MQIDTLHFIYRIFVIGDAYYIHYLATLRVHTGILIY